jgi:hypothetical protein
VIPQAGLRGAAGSHDRRLFLYVSLYISGLYFSALKLPGRIGSFDKTLENQKREKKEKKP